ncbi:MAG: DUF3784 domain-containing protein [Bacteroidaceae bacterium]|nr:DUF3784 domain-containing protein [Bacteroidaceae bacterium]
MVKNLIYVFLFILASALGNTLLGGLSGYVLVSLVLAILIFIGKGDNLIAGYNTDCNTKIDKYHIKRLRLLSGVCLTLLAGLMAFRDMIGLGISIIIILLLCIAAIILAYTWAKK